MRALAHLLRRVVKPRLARTPTPQQARGEFETLAKHVFRRPPYLLRRVDVGADGAPDIHWVTAGRRSARGVIVYFHGGAYFAGSPATHEGLAGRLSALTGREVAVPRYRLAPEDPAPAAFDDARAAYRSLLSRGYAPSEIVLAGDSAGGGLAFALLADLCRDDLAPAAILAFSPWVDLGLESQSLVSNAAADPLLPASRLSEVVDYVLGDSPGGLRAVDARLSPVHASFEAPCPALIQVGRDELLRDDAHRMAARLRRSGGDVRLSEWEGVCHGWQLLDGLVPEARAALEVAAAFIGEHLPRQTP